MKIQIATAATVVKVADAKITADNIEKAIKQTRMFLVQTSGEQNPQIVAEVMRMRERQAVLEAVLHSLKGSHVDLRAYIN
jgi:phosphoribosylanthranilate isomerase